MSTPTCEEGKDATRRRFAWGPPLLAVAYLAAFALILFSVAGFAATWHWALECVGSFRSGYLVCLVALAVVFAVCHRYRFGGVCLLFALLNAGLVLPMYWPARAPEREGRALRVVSFNVYARNTRYGPVRDWIRVVRPDLLVVIECTGRWRRELAALEADYPHVLAEPRGDSFGIALYSRYPLRDARVVYLGGTGLPSLTARVAIDGSALRVLATHTPPPVGARRAAVRNAHLRDVAAWLAKCGRPVLLVGDLNCSTWSPYFRRLCGDSRLRDARKGFGVRATWPAHHNALVRTPIDHCLVSEGLGARRFEVGPYLGSDHLPIVVDLTLVPQAEAQD